MYFFVFLLWSNRITEGLSNTEIVKLSLCGLIESVSLGDHIMHIQSFAVADGALSILSNKI